MIVKKSPNDIFQELRETTECLFGIHLKNPIPINLGFLNLKWKVQTEKGLLLIKQISKERYASYDDEKIILEQDLALREQLRQFENGTLCPREQVAAACKGSLFLIELTQQFSLIRF
ncbi:hypothetical protein ACIQYS_04780 [Psychrobacillus sp. NPDC096426]|uniref:hypothetical protein n=1 Tax=Psychrobacillus sp. NPDC096426 TaxID=3364491 RepID=UPI0038078DDB